MRGYRTSQPCDGYPALTGVPCCPHRGGSQLGAGSASQIPSRARKCFLMCNLRFTPCSTWTGPWWPHSLSCPHTAALSPRCSRSSWERDGPLPHSHPLRGFSFQGISSSTPSATPAGLAPPQHGSWGWAIPSLMACSGLAVPPQLPHPSCSIRVTLSPPGCPGLLWDQSQGHLAAWAGCPGLGCVAAAQGRGAAVFIFHLLQGTTGGFFFFFVILFF